jgi:hypothetical protein
VADAYCPTTIQAEMQTAVLALSLADGITIMRVLSISQRRSVLRMFYPLRNIRRAHTLCPLRICV